MSREKSETLLVTDVRLPVAPKTISSQLPVPYLSSGRTPSLLDFYLSWMSPILISKGTTGAKYASVMSYASGKAGVDGYLEWTFRLPVPSRLP